MAEAGTSSGGDVSVSKAPIWLLIVLTVVAVAGAPVSAWIVGNETVDSLKASYQQQRQAQFEDLRRTTYLAFLKAVDVAYQANAADEAKLREAEDQVTIVGDA